MHTYPAILGIAYLLGSIPFGFLLVLLVEKRDVRAHGSGNIGATNVMRSGNKTLGILTFLLDTAKGYAGVTIAAFLAGGSGGATVVKGAAILAGLTVILGHIFPVWLGFKGGKGVATALGVFLALSPWAALLATAIFAAIAVTTRYVSLASIIAAAVLPFLTLALTPGRQSALFHLMIFACPALVIAKHRQNIVRLTHGVENRFGKARATQA